MFRRPLAALLASALFVQPAAAAPKLSTQVVPPPRVPMLPVAVASAHGLSAAAPSPAIVPVGGPAAPARLGALGPGANAHAADALPAQGELQGLAADRDHALGARLRFDGSLAGSADRGDPVVAPLDQKAEKPKSFLRRLNESTAGGRGQAWLQRGLLFGTIGGSLIPFALHAAPIHQAVLYMPATLGALILAAVSLTVFRATRFLVKGPRAARPPTSNRKIALALAAGLALGTAFGLAPNAFHAPIVEKIAPMMVKQQKDVRLVRGTALRDAVIETLSANPVGRRVLDGLRDRLGMIRLPDFYLSSHDAIASHMPLFDAVFIERAAVTGRGISEESFLHDPAAQRAFARSFAEFFAHELTHAAQARGSILGEGSFKDTIEAEWEAYLVQHEYIHEQLRLAPESVDFNSLGEYETVLDNLDEYLAEIRRSPTYKANPSVSSARWRAFIAPISAPIGPRIASRATSGSRASSRRSRSCGRDTKPRPTRCAGAAQADDAATPRGPAGFGALRPTRRRGRPAAQRPRRKPGAAPPAPRRARDPLCRRRAHAEPRRFDPGAGRRFQSRARRVQPAQRLFASRGADLRAAPALRRQPARPRGAARPYRRARQG